MQKTIDLQGHRGCRGLMPENTIPGFLKALEIGVTTLEMDLFISKDHKVVVSHEPYFSHLIATDPDGKSISSKNERLYNLYEMNYDEIMQYDVGLKPHPSFPRQEKLHAIKPLFADVVRAAEQAVDQNAYQKPFYNVEIKRVPWQDEVYHPHVREFVKLVVEAIWNTGIENRIVVQSFDPQSLQRVREIDPKIGLVLLVGNDRSPEENLSSLGFTPKVYSPEYSLVNEGLLIFCKENNMELIPWTVNNKQQMIRMIELEVDGIITDYPDILHEAIEVMNVTMK
ncbi:MAG: glycerophosphodiester phosphodiesterase [Bacteroidia bacterium]|nr:glycerophosphodiester phosphodiesterase [Bacteroidia bacterium]MBT8276958.1 glycerophosphodiester phosphodiesterase [Bacteroidia bacterium]NNF31078.1 glycerophosphodiester phosphodiesterase [Flavobacteriaceae bacterium]NNK55311.1 glycerophosphodiester phosphodiesterase [Flavobacteriaceae bacterium]NNM09943.1 glycerophosphodiester phosphodiesterase [Flavobacteriaceae bacterium]